MVPSIDSLASQGFNVLTDKVRISDVDPDPHYGRPLGFRDPQVDCGSGSSSYKVAENAPKRAKNLNKKMI